MLWKIIKISIGFYLQFCRYAVVVIAIAVCWHGDSGIGGRLSLDAESEDAVLDSHQARQDAILTTLEGVVLYPYSLTS